MHLSKNVVVSDAFFGFSVRFLGVQISSTLPRSSQGQFGGSVKLHCQKKMHLRDPSSVKKNASWPNDVPWKLVWRVQSMVNEDAQTHRINESPAPQTTHGKCFELIPRQVDSSWCPHLVYAHILSTVTLTEAWKIQQFGSSLLFYQEPPRQIPLRQALTNTVPESYVRC